MANPRKPHGMLFFRDAGLDPEGKPVMMVVGLLHVPDAEVEPECQYAVTDIEVHKTTKVDQVALARGLGIGSLLQQPIWRT